MKRIVISLIFLWCYSEASSSYLEGLQYSGVNGTYKKDNYKIERENRWECSDIGITPENVFGGSWANTKVVDGCKKTFITTLGTVQPMIIDEKIKTVGELEVLYFVKQLLKMPDNYLLLDARKSNWYNKGTIPFSTNIVYNEIHYDENFPEDFDRVLKILNIQKKTKRLDFRKAKELVVFCNGSWCPQSVRAIKELVDLGYPKDKISWYRGGLQDWRSLSFTTIIPKKH